MTGPAALRLRSGEQPQRSRYRHVRSGRHGRWPRGPYDLSLVMYPDLNRVAARRDLTVLDRWEQRVEMFYKAELSGADLRFDPRDDTGRDNALRDWEQAARRDREWADGYRRGLADAAIEDDSMRQGPGVMPDDPKDGWSPSLERLSGYEDGLTDGSQHRTP